MTRGTVGLWVAAALSLAAAGEGLAPGAPAPDVAALAAGTKAAPAVLVDTQAMAADWSASMLARPLFRPDRRPVAAAIVADVAAAPLPRLSAIVVTTAGAAAIFDDGSGTPAVVRAGGAVGGSGYTVKNVGADSVALTGAAGARILRPQFGPGGDPPEVAAADAAAPAGAPPNPASWRRNLDNE